MKRTITKVLAALMTVALVMSAVSVAAFAATTTPYVATASDTTTFDKYLVVEEGSVVPNVEFEYTISTEDMAIPATSTTMEVLAGVGSPNVETAKFTNESTTQVGGESPAELTGKTYAVDSVVISFAGITFPEPGVYRYKLTEQDMVSPYSSLDASPYRYLDVYVVNSETVEGELEIESYVLHTDNNPPAKATDGGSADVAADGDELGTKSAGYINKYGTNDLGFSKRITGNQAAKDKYFKFTVKVNNLVAAADVFNVVITGADGTVAENAATNAEYVGKTNVTTVTGAKLNAGVDFYLNDGQYITIKDLPVGASYTVTEAAEDYVSSDGNDIVAVAGDSTADPAVPDELYDDAKSGTLETDKYVGFTNTRDGIIPTGVLVTIAPFAIGLLLFGAIILFVISRRRRAAY